MVRHGRDSFFVVGEGVLAANETGGDRTAVAEGPVAPAHLSEAAELRQFRFSRIGPQGQPASIELLTAMAEEIVANKPDHDSSIPAGFTYLGQFVDHDLTKDNTVADLGSDVTVDQLLQGRSPALDLDSLYADGPTKNPEFYSDGVHLKMGSTSQIGEFGPRDGFDLPRDPQQRLAVIPDPRNDENLVVAQTHLAFIRFHNRVVDTTTSGSGATRFAAARERVTKHYQWMLRHDYLPRIVDPGIVDDVFTNGRKLFETNVVHGDAPTMPIEFSVAAFRLGHSMVRAAYNWNKEFDNGGGTLRLLFRFSATSGVLGNGAVLPSNWIADFRRLYDFGEAGRSDLVVARRKRNVAHHIDTRLTDPLRDLPAGSFGDPNDPFLPIQANLAFRNLVRGNMVRLASGQQMAELAEVAALTPEQIIEGEGNGVDFGALPADLRSELGTNTPLWTYILREAELNGGRLTGVGGRIVAEVFHRAMEGSTHSIVREPHWRPDLGPNSQTFRMVDLLLFAFEGNAALLNPLGDDLVQQTEIVEVRDGAEGPFVTILQHLLRARGFGLKVDGIFGEVTDQAVRRFQGNQGIVVDGVVGPITWSRLFIRVQRHSTGEAVKGVQVRMNLRQGDPIAVDGEFGPVTEAAVRDFQLDQDLEVDGIVGPITWRRCVSELN